MHLRLAMTTLALAASITLPACSFAQGASGAASGKMVPPAQIFDKLLSSQEKEIVGIAEAMPADKFDFVPSDKIGLYDGVSSFSAQVKHLTSVNYGSFSAFNVPGGKSRAEIQKLTTRDEILGALKASYQYDHAAIATITQENAFAALDEKGDTRAGIVAGTLAHNNDHYGQLVEYLRMNGLIPPASRR